MYDGPGGEGAEESGSPQEQSSFWAAESTSLSRPNPSVSNCGIVIVQGWLGGLSMLKTTYMMFQYNMNI